MRIKLASQILYRVGLSRFLSKSFTIQTTRSYNLTNKATIRASRSCFISFSEMDGKRLGEIQIENKPSAFDDLMKFVKKHTTKGLTPVYGMEDIGGNGRALTVPCREEASC